MANFHKINCKKVKPTRNLKKLKTRGNSGVRSENQWQIILLILLTSFVQTNELTLRGNVELPDKLVKEES